MEEDLVQLEDLHHHGVEREPKAGGEEVTEDDHLVSAGTSDSFACRRWANVVCRHEAMTNQVIEQGWRHPRQAEYGGRWPL